MSCLAAMLVLPALFGFWLMFLAMTSNFEAPLSSRSSKRLALFGLTLVLPLIAVLVAAHAEWGCVSEGLQAKIVDGMHADEVTALLGSPTIQSTRDDGTSLWYYRCDWMALAHFGVFLNADRRVTRTAIFD